MSKVFYVFTVILLLTACSPYGLTGGPGSDSNSDNNESTPEEMEAMENMKTFPTTFEQFEKSMRKRMNEAELDETETGFETKDHLIQIDYKNDSSDENKTITNIYVLINQHNKDFADIEKDFITISEMIFSSLEVSHDVNELVTSIKENKVEAMDTADVLVELTNNTENTQMIISPK